jgi:UMF1 family MFS transporter
MDNLNDLIIPQESQSKNQEHENELTKQQLRNVNRKRKSLPMKFEDLSTTTQRELSGFYSISVGMEGYSAIGIAAFLPLIIQNLAANVAFTQHDHSFPCNTSTAYTCDVLVFNMWWIDTSAIVLYCTSISVILQFILFIALGALADYGILRKCFLLFFGITSAQVGSLILLVWEDHLYWLACIIYIVSNALYGASWIFSYAWVPIISRFDPRVQCAINDDSISQVEMRKISDHVANEISSNGFMYGYFSVVVQLIIWCTFIFFSDGRIWGLTETYPMQIAVAAVCFFQVFVLLGYTLPRLPKRPGPPLPNGSTYIGLSLWNCKILL